MKKLIFAASLLGLFFVSCSEDDDNGDQNMPTGVLVSKTVETGTDGEYTSDFVYNGNKLVKITSDDGALFEATYAGDNIVKFTYKDPDGVVYQTDNFLYDSQGRLASYTLIEPLDGLGYKEVYTYDSNGNVAMAAFNGDTSSQTNPVGTGSVTFANGEVSVIETASGSTLTYTYDNKNNPIKNITGFAKISFYGMEASGILHNVTMQDDNTNDWDESTTYTYNALDYPASSVETSDVETITTQFFYQ